MRNRSRSGQSLIDVLIASGLGAILLVGALSVLAPALRGTSDAQFAQSGAALARGLQDSVRSFAASNWSIMLGLTQGSPYYLTQTVSGAVPVAGTETVGGGSAASLVGNWKLDDTTTASATNAVPNQPAGTSSGTPTATTTCRISTCWNFNGSSAYVDITGNPTVYRIDNGTMSAWIKTSAPGTGLRGIVVKQGAYGMYLNSNEFGIYDFNVGWRGSGVSLNDNAWHHVACSYQTGVTNGTLCYIDGVLRMTTTMTVNNQGTADLMIGYGNAASTQFGGTIDDVRMYNTLLGASSIAQLAAGTISGESYTRSFKVDPVRRGSTGQYVTSGGYVDSSTLLLTITYQWPRGPAHTLTSFLTRAGAKAMVQTDWSGGGGQNSAVTNPGNQFSTSTSILNYATSTGSLVLDLGAGGGGSGATPNINSTTSEHFAWSDLFGWLNFYSSGTAGLGSSKMIGYANSSIGQISLDCATSPAGNICGSSNYYVTNNGLGTLAGWAWSDAYGWISFNCSNHGGCSPSYSVTVNSNTGVFSGYAWNDIAGWISFNCADIGICGTSDYKVVSSWRASSTSGYLDSATIDTGSTNGVQLNAITWSGSKPAGTDVRFTIATSSSSSGPWTFVGSDGLTSSYYTTASGVGAPLYPWILGSARYFRYRVLLVSDAAQTVSPRVDSVVARWSP